MLGLVRQDLEGAFAGLSGANIPTVVYENVEPSATGDEFIRPSIAFAPSATDIGFQGVSRVDGTVVVQIFTEVGRGVGRAYVIGDAVASSIQNTTFANGTVTTTASIRSVGIDKESRGLYQHNLIIPFRFIIVPESQQN